MKQADREIIDQLNRIYDAVASGGGGATAFADITGSPEDNTALDAALDAKQGSLGFTAVPDTRTVNGHALSDNVTVSKGDVGLGNADNTADTAKPVSTAQQTALDLKASIVYVDARGIPQNAKSADYTLVAADANKHILHALADDNPRTFTIPANGTVPYLIGTAISFVNLKNTLTIAITTDTLRLANSDTVGSRTLANGGIATAIKVAADYWLISGVGLT